MDVTESETSRREKKSGILKLDITKTRNASAGSVEFKEALDYLGQVTGEALIPISPQPSVDRLSVTWAEPESPADTKVAFSQSLELPTPEMEVRFPITPGVEASEDEDYSASVSAIMLRRGSTRRSRRSRLAARRPSSPFPPDIDVGTARRRSSAYTTSSGETAISMEETGPQEVTQEQIYDNIRLHKEVLHSVNQQPLGMRRKLKLVHQAKAYIKRHEGALQERLAQSKSTRDIVARFNILLATKWQHMKREAANLSNLLIPWELRIKEIESHFGSVVASYFTFLRWLFWVNIIIAVMLITFVIVPEILTAADDPDRKQMLPEEKNVSINLLILWEFEGVLKYSPIFYGFYSNKDSGEAAGYRMPFAYFMTGLAVYVYSFVATLRKMAENSRMSKLSEKEDECIFSWKLFTGWDFMIGNTETAHNRTSSIILGFKEALLEEAEKKKDPRNWKIISLRVLVNTCVLILLGISAFAVVSVVRRSKAEGAEGWWDQNEITIVISLITFIFPYLFEILGLLEGYHPRKQLRVQLGRIMLLNLLNLYAMIIALFNKITEMTRDLEEMNPNKLNMTSTTIISPSRLKFEGSTLTDTGATIPSITQHIEPCRLVEVNCSTDFMYSSVAPASLLRNFTLLVAAALITTTNAPAIQTAVMTTSNNKLLEPLIPPTLDTQSVISTPNVSMMRSNDTSEENSDEIDDYGAFDYLSITNYKVVGDLDRKNEEPATNSPTDISTTLYTNGHSRNTPTSYDLYNSESTTIIDTITEKSTTQLDNTMSDTTISDYPATTNTYTTSDIITDSTTALYTTDTTESTLNFSEMTYPASPSTNTSFSINNEYIESSTYNYPKETQSDILTKVPTTVSHVEKSSEQYETSTKPCFIRKCNINVAQTTLSTTTQSTTVATPTSTETLEQKQAKEVAKVLENKRKLRKLCWETMFGQEMVKLTMMDMMMTIITTLFMDFIRAVFVRFMNRCWCWDLEKKFPQYGDFKIAENILHLVNNQGMVWMGMFFSPGLVLINIIKLIIMMYLRSWAVMTCNVPHEVVFRASRSNNFYLALLLTMLFLCVLPVGYAIVWVKPSWHCGPFAGYERMYYLVTTSLDNFLPLNMKLALDYMASPGIVIPLLVLLVLIIYYLLSLTNSLREANNDLKIQLRRERTEERRKMFQIADRRRRVGSNDLENTPFAKWKKILPMLPPSKSIDSNEKKGNEEAENGKVTKKIKGDIFAKIVKMARKSNEGTVAVDENTLTAPMADDESDTEFHETLPEDLLRRTDIKKIKLSTSDKTKNEKKQTSKRDGDGTADPKDKHMSEEKQSVFIKLEDEITSQKTKKSRRKLRRQETEGNQPETEPKKKYRSRKYHTEDYASRDSTEKTYTMGDKNENDVSEIILELKKKETVHQKDSFELKSSKRLKNKPTNDVNIQSTKPFDSSSVIPVITISKMESDDETLDKADPSVTSLSSLVMAQQYDDDDETSSTNSAVLVKKSGSCASLKTLKRQSSVDSINDPEKSTNNRKN